MFRGNFCVRLDQNRDGVCQLKRLFSLDLYTEKYTDIKSIHQLFSERNEIAVPTNKINTGNLT